MTRSSPLAFVFILLAMLAAVQAARADDPPSLAGHWTGTLKAGGSPARVRYRLRQEGRRLVG